MWKLFGLLGILCLVLLRKFLVWFGWVMMSLCFGMVCLLVCFCLGFIFGLIISLWYSGCLVCVILIMAVGVFFLLDCLNCWLFLLW